MAKRSIDQNLRSRNFEARNGRIELGTLVKNQSEQRHVHRGPGDCWQWKADGRCSKRDKCSFRHDKDKRAKPTSPSFSRTFDAAGWEKSSENQKSWRPKPKWEECLDCRARITSKKLAPLHSVKNGILQSACSTSLRMDADLGKNSLTHTARLTNSLTKSLKKNGDSNAVAILKDTGQLGSVFQDMEPPKSASILRKSSNILRPIRCVQFSKVVLRHVNIRDQKHSLGKNCPGCPHQRGPNVPKFEDQSQEETDWQERWARAAAWRLASNIPKLKEKN